MKNSLQSRDDKTKMFKGLYESAQKELVELREKYDRTYVDNLDLQKKLDMLNSQHSEMIQRTHSTLVARVAELEGEKKALEEQVKASLRLVEHSQAQQILMEEKFNVKRQKTNVDPKDRVVMRLVNEFGIQAESTKMILFREMEQAVALDPGIFKPLV